MYTYSTIHKVRGWVEVYYESVVQIKLQLELGTVEVHYESPRDNKIGFINGDCKRK